MTMRARQTDWKRVRAFIASLPDVPTKAQSLEDKRWADFCRMEDFLGRAFYRSGANYRPEFRDRLLEISDEFHLTILQTAHLAKLLAEAQSEHAVLVAWQKSPSASAAATALQDIQNSVLRIARLSESSNAAKLAAVDYLSRAVGRRMRTTPVDELRSLGLERQSVSHPTAGEISTDNSSDAVYRWLRLARFIHEAISDEVPRLSQYQSADKHAEYADWRVLKPSATTPIVALIGGRLPAIYEVIFRKRFGRQRQVETATRPFDGLQDSDGMRFVRLCLGALGLGHYELETISRHYTEFRTASQPDADPEIL